jgi:nuclear pore complex protein Nup62
MKTYEGGGGIAPCSQYIGFALAVKRTRTIQPVSNHTKQNYPHIRHTINAFRSCRNAFDAWSKFHSSASRNWARRNKFKKASNCPASRGYCNYSHLGSTAGHDNGFREAVATATDCKWPLGRNGSRVTEQVNSAFRRRANCRNTSGAYLDRRQSSDQFIMYVCIYICTYMCVYMYVCTYICMYEYMYMCMYVYVCVCMCTYVCMCVRMYVYVCIYVRMCIHLYVWVYVCICVCVCIRVCMYEYMYVYE